MMFETFDVLDAMFFVCMINYFGWAVAFFKNKTEQNKHGFKMANIILWSFVAFALVCKICVA